VRARFPLSGVFRPSGDLVLLAPDDVAADRARLQEQLGAAVAVRARERGTASAVLSAAGRAFVVAAARITRGGRGALGATVVVAAPIDGKALAAAARSACDVAVGLSDGARMLEALGPPAARPPLVARVGHENERPTSGSPAIAWPLGDRLWLLAAFPPPPAPPPGPPWSLARFGPALAGACPGLALFATGLIAALVGRRRQR